MEFQIRTDESSVKLQARNWIAAFSQAIDLFDLHINDIAEMKAVQKRGKVSIDVGDLHFDIEPIAPELKVIAAYVEPPEPDPDGIEFADLDDFTDDVIVDPDAPPPPKLEMPMVSTLELPEQVFYRNDFAERLFDLSLDIAAAEHDEACLLALRLICEQFLPCAYANVVRGGLSDREMVYLVGFGETGERLVGHTSPLGQGLVGMCHFSGLSMQVSGDDLTAERLVHLPEDLHEGVEHVILFPVVNNDGWAFGVVQLVNPSGEIAEHRMEAAAAVARTLGANLAQEL